MNSIVPFFSCYRGPVDGFADILSYTTMHDICIIQWCRHHEQKSISWPFVYGQTLLFRTAVALATQHELPKSVSVSEKGSNRSLILLIHPAPSGLSKWLEIEKRWYIITSSANQTKTAGAEAYWQCFKVSLKLSEYLDHEPVVFTLTITRSS